MAKTALNQLQDQIDAVRREAYAAGYAAAMQSIREFVSKQAAGSEAGPGEPQRRQSGRGSRAAQGANATPPGRQRRSRNTERPASARGGRSRPQRGNNARLIEEILQENAPRALRPAEIRTALQRDKGVAMAFTSIRHALGQLEGREVAEQIADSKTWRYRESAPASE
jgi:hypothetical protein